MSLELRKLADRFTGAVGRVAQSRTLASALVIGGGVGIATEAQAGGGDKASKKEQVIAIDPACGYSCFNEGKGRFTAQGQLINGKTLEDAIKAGDVVPSGCFDNCMLEGAEHIDGICAETCCNEILASIPDEPEPSTNEPTEEIPKTTREITYPGEPSRAKECREGYDRVLRLLKKENWCVEQECTDQGKAFNPLTGECLDTCENGYIQYDPNEKELKNRLGCVEVTCDDLVTQLTKLKEDNPQALATLLAAAGFNNEAEALEALKGATATDIEKAFEIVAFLKNNGIEDLGALEKALKKEPHEEGLIGLLEHLGITDALLALLVLILLFRAGYWMGRR